MVEQEGKIEDLKYVYFFQNGNVVATDGNYQIPELQQSWFLLFVEFLKLKGIKNIGSIRFKFPNGETGTYSEKNHNWEFIERE